MVQVRITHKGAPYEIEIDEHAKGTDLMQAIAEKTGVPAGNQKIVLGAFGPDKTIAEMKLPNRPIMVFGSAPEAPKDSAGGQAGQAPEAARRVEPEPVAIRCLPPGLDNSENTCYMNSVLQVLRSIPELSSALFKYKPGSSNSNLPQVRLTVALQSLFAQMNQVELFDPKTRSVSAQDFLKEIRAIVPQFAERSREEDNFAQQDASEALTAITSRLEMTLRTPAGSADDSSAQVSWIEKYMTAQALCTRKCLDLESTDPVEQMEERMYQLSCHINRDVNHLWQGLKLGLTDSMEKRSESLGRDAKFEKTAELSRLPKYLPIQLMRFSWKTTNEGTKAKIVRKVTFPTELDITQFCTSELKTKIVPIREEVQRYRDADTELFRARRREEALRASRGGAPAEPAEGESEKDPNAELKESLETSKKKLQELLKEQGEAAIDAGSNPTGLYELCGIVTHRGRYADSGHYLSFAKPLDAEDKNQWWCFDDANVYAVDDGRISTLYGGNADGPMAFLLLYRAVTVPS